MRCIEMYISYSNDDVRTGLIETWDVLKLSKEYCSNCMIEGLIETWDVLKC